MYNHVYILFCPPDSCIYGDYADVYGSSGLRCHDLINQNPSLCYKERESQDCCSSCAQKKDLNNPGDCSIRVHFIISSFRDWQTAPMVIANRLTAQISILANATTKTQETDAAQHVLDTWHRQKKTVNMAIKRLGVATSSPSIATSAAKHAAINASSSAMDPKVGNWQKWNWGHVQYPLYAILSAEKSW